MTESELMQLSEQVGLALKARGEGITRRECFSGDRDAVRRQATAYALQTLWQQFLQNT